MVGFEPSDRDWTVRIRRGREMSGPWVDLVKVRGLFSKKAMKGYVLI